ncbi:hypothetical protein AAFF_G00439350 [Aldrovandia affinis]|uniref:Uncharacterized protein n=1 Tax=Aldrovandia affinis TaxID=143900 RepID=A0AAD7S9S5_9TELE|nr:hypothetical protein AAFF_G00439350 [Aldrovandia affinis]
MSNIPPFHTQLASIMEVLANAAVAEICELVDNGYAVLHLEISRSQKENKALKRKLHMMELRIARGSDEKKARTSSVNICSERVRICDELRQTTSRDSEEGYLPTAERAVGSRMGISVWGDGEPMAVEDTTIASTTKNRSADNEKINLESLLIKKEKLEEDVENSDPLGGLNISEERSVESDGGERAPIVDTQTAPAADTEELTEQHRTRHSVWEDSGLDTVLKAETEIETINLQDTAGRLNSLGNEYGLYERPVRDSNGKWPSTSGPVETILHLTLACGDCGSNRVGWGPSQCRAEPIQRQLELNMHWGFPDSVVFEVDGQVLALQLLQMFPDRIHIMRVNGSGPLFERSLIAEFNAVLNFVVETVPGTGTVGCCPTVPGPFTGIRVSSFDLGWDTN